MWRKLFLSIVMTGCKIIYDVMVWSVDEVVTDVITPELPLLILWLRLLAPLLEIAITVLYCKFITQLWLRKDGDKNNPLLITDLIRIVLIFFSCFIHMLLCIMIIFNLRLVFRWWQLYLLIYGLCGVNRVVWQPRKDTWLRRLMKRRNWTWRTLVLLLCIFVMLCVWLFPGI